MWIATKDGGMINLEHFSKLGVQEIDDDVWALLAFEHPEEDCNCCIIISTSEIREDLVKVMNLIMMSETDSTYGLTTASLQ